jgi:hypothetical protein
MMLMMHNQTLNRFRGVLHVAASMAGQDQCLDPYPEDGLVEMAAVTMVHVDGVLGRYELPTRL